MAQINETVLEIDLKAIKHNFDFFRSRISDTTKFLAVVKAFGYGSDAVEVAKYLEELKADYFAVAYVSEGIALREAGIKTPILVLHAQKASLEKLIEYELEPSLYSPYILKAFLEVVQDRELKDYPVHIKFNTGLNRLGFWENDVDYIIDKIKDIPQLKVSSVFSHLAASEDVNEKDFSQTQISNFKKIAAEFTEKIGYRPMMHQLNTSGIINYPEAQFDMVRCGIGLYGFGNDPEIDPLLKPVASLKTVISQIHMIEPGESVGYNRAYKAEHYAKTATLPVGHADGIGRQYGNKKGYVSINGHRAPIIGNVCMDMLMVDITGIDCREGDEVVVFGNEPTAEEFAATAATISYELLTAVSQRVKRSFLR
ncbi:alanine racemase [Leptobacterium flavescens]|uniref:Alanine racemase n=1 Tax=Leptobacterium flavescens TaxID=472055 RepID=A0A6P0UP51_9FLAO|nr:alanine racemase [Leptobacterium flavescens]NER14272.1 alanine racemase [Leptobacterium flavescens]